MNKIIMEALIDCLLFLELCDDGVINPDAAVRQMENVGYKLRQLPEAQRVEFIGFARNLALQAADQSTERREFLLGIEEGLGLID